MKNVINMSYTEKEKKNQPAPWPEKEDVRS